MICKVCGHDKSKVCQTISGFDSDEQEAQIVRKRKCLQCGTYFYTTEKFLGYTMDSARKLITNQVEKDLPGILDAIRDIVESRTVPTKSDQCIHISIGGKKDVKTKEDL